MGHLLHKKTGNHIFLTDFRSFSASTRGFEPPTPRLGVLNAGPGNFIRFHQKSLIFRLFSGSRCSVRTAFYHCFSPFSAPNCCNFVASPKISTNGWLDHSWLIYALRLSAATKSGSFSDVPFSSISSFFLSCISRLSGSIIPEIMPVNNGISSGIHGEGASAIRYPSHAFKASLMFLRQPCCQCLQHLCHLRFLEQAEERFHIRFR